MTSHFIIRKAEEKDAEQIIQHTKKVLEENSPFMGTSLEEFSITVEKEREFIKTHEEHGLILVAEMDKTIIGFLNFRLSSKKKFQHQGLFGMSIQEAYTNKGIGRALIQELLKWAEADPRVEKISLEVFSNNKRAIHLYSKLGFVEEGRRKKAAKLGPNEYVDDIFMSKFLKI
ncbi:GNAT family N-acetyltransferase [Neobacillus sp. D3-1R]|uniref:GNAT family N-acetyltransferase n=1 Tax=Neobacillus sp. D3-1R TaxID=3445778 RepID=UPI003FA17DDD